MTWPSSPAYAATTWTSTGPAHAAPARGRPRPARSGQRARARRRRRPAVAVRVREVWSGWPDLNRRPPAPKAGALPGCATPRRTPTISHPPRGRGAARAAPRPPAVVAARLLLEGQLGERAAARRVEEHGIVAEAVGAPRRLGDAALDQALDDLGAPVGIGERDHAAEARGAPRGRDAR